MNQKERGEAFRRAASDRLPEERKKELRRMREERRRRERRKRFLGYGGIFLAAAAATVLVIWGIASIRSLAGGEEEGTQEVSVNATVGETLQSEAAESERQTEAPTETEGQPVVLVDGPEWAKIDYLTPNPNSRPQTPLTEVKNIVIHYVGNPNTTAQSNRDYFEQLKNNVLVNGKVQQASSHFVVGLEGEVVQCVPLNEVAYATKWRNVDTVSIEVCHPDAEGKFNEKTYNGLIRLTAWLCGQYGLSGDDLLRHYDVTQKKCPLYYVDHPEAWEQLKRDVDTYIASGQV